MARFLFAIPQGIEPLERVFVAEQISEVGQCYSKDEVRLLSQWQQNNGRRLPKNNDSGHSFDGHSQQKPPSLM